MTEETAGMPITEDFVEHSHPQYGMGYFCTEDVLAKVAALTTQLDESESQRLGWKKLCENWNEQANKSRQPDVFYEDYNEGTMRAMKP